jgi:hypothetical protein
VATVRATTGNAIPFECSQYRATGVRSADGKAGQHMRDAPSRTTISAVQKAFRWELEYFGYQLG